MPALNAVVEEAFADSLPFKESIVIAGRAIVGAADPAAAARRLRRTLDEVWS